MIACVWLSGELVGDHVHVKVSTGVQHAQDDMPTYDQQRGHHNDAGGAGALILRRDQWFPFVRAMATGGFLTGLRVVWRCRGLDERFLWNGAQDAPCVVGTRTPCPWEHDSGP